MVFSVSKSMFISPCIVTDVVGVLVRMVSTAFCKFFTNSVSWWGRLYMLITVWSGFVFWLLLWICKVIVAALGILMSSCVMFRSCLWYTETSLVWYDRYWGIGKLFWLLLSVI